MPFQVGPTCYSTLAEAGIAQALSLGNGEIVLIGNLAYVHKVVAVESGGVASMQHRYERAGDGALLFQEVVPWSAPGCGTLDPADFGVTAPQMANVVGWGFGAVLLGFTLGYVLSLAVGLIRKA